MPTREDLEQALEIAQAEFRDKDPEEQARRCGAHWIVTQSHPKVGIPFLGKYYEILIPGGEIHYKEIAEEPALWEKILVLHYFNRADGSPLTGRYIDFRQIPEGRIYEPAFERRVIHPLLARYGSTPEEILCHTESVQGSKMDLGDLSLKIPLFPHVPVIVVFWKPDKEFGPRVTILFDSSVTRYLPTEDIVLSAQMMALHLVRQVK